MDIPDDRRRRSPSPAAAPPPPKPFIPFSLGNGSLRNHAVYRQCMKNHAAAMGGHAVDGCGEFMPSNVTDPADPSSLACAACGCHRNFHRRILHPDPIAATALGDDRGYRSSATPPRNQMLVPFGGALRRGPLAAPPRKRARTKFTDEQKLRMKELSEKLGWRMQKGDGATVEIACREMGVSMGVFKVWMHNNKHIFVGGSSSRRAGGGGGGGGGRDNSQALSDKTDDEAGGAATGLAAGSPTTPS